MALRMARRMEGVLRAPHFRVALGLVVFVALNAAAFPRARAHPDLDQALASAQDAEFELALSGFERAIASGTLTRDELITLLAERALVLHALGQRGALAWDLATLALIEPGHNLGRRAPPELVNAFADATSRQGAAAAVRASCEPSSTGLRVTAKVTGLSDPSLASVKIRTRPDQSPETVNDASDVEVAVEPGESLGYSAELVGLGKVVLAQDGSTEKPKMCELPKLEKPSLVDARPDRKDGKSHKLWWWVGAGGAVVLGAVTVGIVLATQSDEQSEDTSVGRPMVSF